MSVPSTQTRTDVYVRDGYRCVMCTTTEVLSFQHRRAVGMGGSKNLPTTVDGLTLCVTCNNACEAELQGVALANGWKVRRWANPERVPVFYPAEHAWYRLEGVRRVPISSAVAMEMGCSVYGDEWMQWRLAVIVRGR